MLLCSVIGFIDFIIGSKLKKLVWTCYNLKDIFHVFMSQLKTIHDFIPYILLYWKYEK